MACDWALSIEKKIGDLPNMLVNQRVKWGKPAGNWGGNDVPWEMARAVALKRLGRIEEASSYFAQETLPAMEAYLLDQAKEDDRYRSGKSWFYKRYLAPDVEFQDIQGDIQFPDPRCLMSEYNSLKELVNK